jgi:hypothetical protein
MRRVGLKKEAVIISPKIFRLINSKRMKP